jgi:cytoskeletal protein CcmA (bactofilin family)
MILLIASAGAGIWLYRQSTGSTNDLLPQSVSQATLDQLTNSDVTVGEPQHTLSVQSNAVFSGDVLVRSNLQIAGNLQVGSSLAIAGIRVTGNSTFDDVRVTKSIAVTGNSSIQGQLNIQKNLNVNGDGTFIGTLAASALTVNSLQLNGDLVLTHHLTAGGSTPARSNGSALGSGGTVSISGSDTAGSITINTGGSPNAGCFVSVTFVTKFNSTPRIALTPTSSGAAGIGYYATRTTTGFSVCTVSTPPTGSTVTFDYIALD